MVVRLSTSKCVLGGFRLSLSSRLYFQLFLALIYTSFTIYMSTPHLPLLPNSPRCSFSPAGVGVECTQYTSGCRVQFYTHSLTFSLSHKFRLYLSPAVLLLTFICEFTSVCLFALCLWDACVLLCMCLVNVVYMIVCDLLVAWGNILEFVTFVQAVVILYCPFVVIFTVVSLVVLYAVG